MRSNRDTKLENIMESMYGSPTPDAEQTTESPEEAAGIGSTVSGDPSTWQVGQIIPSQISGDDYDGIILDIGEENGEQTFHVMQVGPEGWSVPTSNLNLPDTDTGRIPVTPSGV
jgi:hypothetical protein